MSNNETYETQDNLSDLIARRLALIDERDALNAKISSLGIKIESIQQQEIEAKGQFKRGDIVEWEVGGNYSWRANYWTPITKRRGRVLTLSISGIPVNVRIVRRDGSDGKTQTLWNIRTFTKVS